MSFGGMFDGGGGGGGSGGGSGAFSYGAGAAMPPSGTGAMTHPRLLSPAALAESGFASPGLSLGLANMEGQGDMSRFGLIGGGGGGGSGDGDSSVGRTREDENDSRSGSDNVDGVSGDDVEDNNNNNNNPRKKKKRYHRHTPQQIQELEAVFKECPHPDEKQRLELGKRLSLESRQVKFWFQNRRTQMKTQIERHENALLRQENDKLRAENLTIREAMRSPMCTNCGGPAALGDVTLEEQHLRIENARLKDELDRVCALAGKFLGRSVASLSTPSPPLPCSALELAVGTNGFSALGSLAPAPLPPIPDFLPPGIASPAGTAAMRMPPGMNALVDGMHDGVAVDRGVLLELALAAMEELIKVAQMDEPLWIPSVDGGVDALNYEEYPRAFPRVLAPSPPVFVSEATRDVGMVITSSVDLVDTLMDVARWADMFQCIVARASTTEIISSGLPGTRSGLIQLMHAELQVLSPLVPIREVSFLRFCKQHAEGLWAVVDVSVDGVKAESGGNYMTCRLLPSGCVVQDMNNGYSKVTWVAHAEYDEAPVHQLCRPLLRSGQALGARRWLASLQRQCQYITILCSNTIPGRDHSAITPMGRRSMLKLAQRMTETFFSGVCASPAGKWRRLDGWRGVRGGGGNGGEEGVRMLTRQSGAPGEPAGVVLSVATSVWLAGMPPQRVFDYLRDERRRGDWDILANAESMQEMTHIAKGQNHGNAVSLLRSTGANANQSSMLILQETCTDPSGSWVVYAPVDVPAMHVVMNGGDSSYVALLPTGFAILPDGHNGPNSDPSAAASHGSLKAPPTDNSIPGSILTVAFQILVNSSSSNARFGMDSVETVSKLLFQTIQNIKSSLKVDIISP